jgi:hypothetical protein
MLKRIANNPVFSSISIFVFHDPHLCVILLLDGTKKLIYPKFLKKLFSFSFLGSHIQVQLCQEKAKVWWQNLYH